MFFTLLLVDRPVEFSVFKFLFQMVVGRSNFKINLPPLCWDLNLRPLAFEAETQVKLFK